MAARKEPKKKVPKKKVPKRGHRLNEVGGETVTVMVTVNGIRKYSRSATITQMNGGRYRYVMDDKRTTFHDRALGYKELAKKLL